MGITLTGYKAGIDNAYAGHPDGGTDTSSGVKLNENYFTCAIPMGKDRTNLNVGDVILVKNKGADGVVRKAVVWVTDVGGLPHGDIDLAKSGALEKQLGVNFVDSKSGRSVAALTGAGDVEVTRLASVNPKGMQNPDAINEAIVKVNARIGEKTDDQIAADFTTEAKNPENITLADANKQKVITNAPGGGHRFRPRDANGDPTDKFRDEDDYVGYLSKLMGTNPLLAIFLLVIGVMSGMISPDQLTGILKGALTGEGPANGYGHGVTNDGVIGTDARRYNGRGVIGGRVQGLDTADGHALELPRFDAGKHKTAGEYFAAAAASFDGIHEVGNNGGPFVKWVLANAGLGTGNPWCAAFMSKMYEGTGLFNYTASALNFAEQGMSTGSYRQGNIDGIKEGDPVIYDRGTSTDAYGHIGMCVKVHRDANGKVVSIDTVEGNSGDAVTTYRNRTLSDLQSNRFLGYVSIEHREAALLERKQLTQPIAKTLAEKWGVGVQVTPEYTPPHIEDMNTVPPAQGPPGKQGAGTNAPSKTGLTIVLDRGHGAMQPGLDTGAVSPYGHHGRKNEIQLANIYQAELKKALEEKGYKVALTSDEIDKHNVYKDADASRYDRTEIAKRAIGDGNGLYLSIHANSAGDDNKWQSTGGAEMFFAGHVAGSEEFANTIASSVKANGGIDVTKVKNYGKGSERNAGEGLRQFEKATCPSALIEMGYLNNAKDYDYLCDDEKVKAQARAAAEGIDKYAKAKGLAKEVDVSKEKDEAAKKAADDAKAKAEADAKAAAEKAAEAKMAAEAKAAAEKAVAEEAAKKAAEEKAKTEKKTDDADANNLDAAKAKALQAVSGIRPENQVTDKQTAAADKNPAEMLAMHNATMQSVNKDKLQPPAAAKSAGDAAKNTSAVLA